MKAFAEALQGEIEGGVASGEGNSKEGGVALEEEGVVSGEGVASEVDVATKEGGVASGEGGVASGPPGDKPEREKEEKRTEGNGQEREEGEKK